jgi:hypothetical protein
MSDLGITPAEREAEACQIGWFLSPEERAAAGERIDPSTAIVWFEYGQVIDPYRDLPELPPDCHCVGRLFWAADPAERIGISFYDLPANTRDLLEPKRNRADRLGWEMILAIGPLGPTD